jgi:hypothetical protein
MAAASSTSVLDSADSPEQLRRYVFWLLAFTATIWLLPFIFVRLPGFLRWSGSNYGSMLEYSFASSNANADVVIFGDSSALFGIDPLQMSAKLGLKTINLPNTMSSLPVTDDMALRQYLAHSAPPRLIVFYFAPWNLNFSNIDDPDKLFDVSPPPCAFSICPTSSKGRVCADGPALTFLPRIPELACRVNGHRDIEARDGHGLAGQGRHHGAGDDADLLVAGIHGIAHVGGALPSTSSRRS